MMNVHHILAVGAALSLGIGVSACDSSTESTYAVGGIVSGSTEVTVALQGSAEQATTTDAAGRFAFQSVTPGTYTVMPRKSGQVFIPPSRDATVASGNVMDLTFTAEPATDGLSAELLAKADAAPESSLPAEEVILPNGQSLAKYVASRGITLERVAPAAVDDVRILALPGAAGPQQKKNDVIAAMLLQARHYACGRASIPCKTWDYEADPKDKKNKPAQKGLTYVYGGKDPSVRTKPVDGCPEMTYGMDCSGLMYRVAAAAGITIPASTAAAQSVPNAWTMPKEWELELKEVNDGTIQSGDIVSWGSHIGIAESDGTRKTANVISSTGRSGDCQLNVTSPRGPRSLAAKNFGTPTKVLRITAKLSGTFDMFIRCSDRTTNASVIRFKIDSDAGGPFTAQGSGTDYDGQPLCFTLNGTYDQVANILSAKLSLCDGSRVDSFTIPLLEDDTGYFPLQKVVDNQGCAAAARLVRVQDPTTPVAVPQPATGSGPSFGSPR